MNDEDCIKQYQWCLFLSSRESEVTADAVEDENAGEELSAADVSLSLNFCKGYL